LVRERRTVVLTIAENNYFRRVVHLKHLLKALFIAVFAVSATSAMASEGADMNWFGDA
jgi:hypothetical protein